MERQRGAQPNCRVIRREIHAELLDVHACQYGLTLLMCQPKLTQQGAWSGADFSPGKRRLRPRFDRWDMNESAMIGLKRAEESPLLEFLLAPQNGMRFRVWQRSASRR